MIVSCHPQRLACFLRGVRSHASCPLPHVGYTGTLSKGAGKGRSRSLDYHRRSSCIRMVLPHIHADWESSGLQVRATKIVSLVFSKSCFQPQGWYSMCALLSMPLLQWQAMLQMILLSGASRLLRHTDSLSSRAPRISICSRQPC
jgi:hypothetical protein